MLRNAVLVLVMSGCSDPAPLTSPAKITDCHLDEDCGAFAVCSCDRCNARNRHVHASLCPGGPCKTNACVGKRAVCVRGTCEIEQR